MNHFIEYKPLTNNVKFALLVILSPSVYNICHSTDYLTQIQGNKCRCNKVFLCMNNTDPEKVFYCVFLLVWMTAINEIGQFYSQSCLNIHPPLTCMALEAFLFDMRNEGSCMSYFVFYSFIVYKYMQRRTLLLASYRASDFF